MTESIRGTDGGAAFAIGGQLLPQPSRRIAFASSLGLHLLAVSLALAFDRAREGEPYAAPTVAEAAAAEGLEITWYRPADLLPAVSPAAAADNPPRSGAQGVVKLQQSIEAASPDPDSLRQTIVNGPPAIRIEEDVETANMLARAPGGESRRQRFELADNPRQAPQSLAPPDLAPPRIDVGAAYGELAAMREIERMRYLPGEQRKREAERQALEAAPAPAVAGASPEARLAALGIVAPMRYQPGETANGLPARTALDAPAPPKILAETVHRIDPSPFQRIGKLRYEAEEPRAAAPQREALAVAPAVAAAAPRVPDAADAGIDAALFQRIEPLRYEAGGAASASGSRTAAARRAVGETNAPAPPEIHAGGADGSPASPGGAGVDPSSLQAIARLRFQQWGGGAERQAPGRRAIGTIGAASAPPRRLPGLSDLSGAPYGFGQAGSALAGGGPPPPPGGGGTAERNLAVVGLDPGKRLPQAIPRGRRKGSFSGGPEPGSGSGGTQTARLHVPNLTIGGRPRTEAALAAVPAPDAAENLRRLGAFRGADALLTFRASAPAGGRAPEAIDPDRPFRGRPSYSLAIDMPNITGASGSWRLQFAEIDGATEQGKLAAPVPRVKVDPRYIREAVEERIEGEVVLHCIIQRDGAIGKLQVVRGIDDRLDAGALTALSKWRFDPARKYGRPVAVEAVVRIPFHVGPATARR